MAKYKFGDIAYNITRVRKYQYLEDKDTYIGLEHMDSGSLSINRYGSEVPLKGEKLVMKFKGRYSFWKKKCIFRNVQLLHLMMVFFLHMV